MTSALSERPGRMFGLWLVVGFALCGVFLYGCLMHSPPQPPGNIPYFDKIEHASAFVAMGAWFGALFRPRWVAVFITLSLFAVATELLQWASGYRDGDPLDWLADSFGILIGLALVRAGVMRWLVVLDRRVATARNRTDR